ncbi:MAG: hypothetical protein KKI08_26020, partial [Armatimonadetes bacterium]|nr:hypothetical protein [Armatimonadota bacterium]
MLLLGAVLQAASGGATVTALPPHYIKAPDKLTFGPVPPPAQGTTAGEQATGGQKQGAPQVSSSGGQAAGGQAQGAGTSAKPVRLVVPLLDTKPRDCKDWAETERFTKTMSLEDFIKWALAEQKETSTSGGAPGQDTGGSAQTAKTASRGMIEPAKALADWLQHNVRGKPHLYVDFARDTDSPRVWGSFLEPRLVGGKLDLSDLHKELTTALRDAWEGIEGFVYYRDKSKGPVPCVGVPVTMGNPEAADAPKTDKDGHFELTASARNDNYMLYVVKPNYSVEVKVSPMCRTFVNIELSEPPAGGTGAAEIISAWSDVLGIGAAAPMLQALGKGLPVQTGVVYSQGSGLRPYFGLEKCLGATTTDRSLRSVGKASIIVQLFDYQQQAFQLKGERWEAIKHHNEALWGLLKSESGACPPTAGGEVRKLVINAWKTALEWQNAYYGSLGMPPPSAGMPVGYQVESGPAAIAEAKAAYDSALAELARVHAVYDLKVD